jgi:hypothetical protein
MDLKFKHQKSLSKRYFRYSNNCLLLWSGLLHCTLKQLCLNWLHRVVSRQNSNFKSHRNCKIWLFFLKCKLTFNWKYVQKLPLREKLLNTTFSVFHYLSWHDVEKTGNKLTWHLKLFLCIKVCHYVFPQEVSKLSSFFFFFLFGKLSFPRMARAIE